MAAGRSQGRRYVSNALKGLVFSALCLIWSSTWLVIKVGLQGAPPFTTAGSRFIIASVVIFAIVSYRRLRLPRTRSFFALTLFLGVFQIGTAYALVYWSEQYLTSGLTAVLFSTMPIMVAILARIILGDRLSVRKITGVVLGTAGVYVIFRHTVSIGGSETAYGIIAALSRGISIAKRTHSDKA